MTRNHDFKSIMAGKGDVELAVIVQKPEDYAPEAVEAAKAEIEKRKASDQQSMSATSATSGHVHRISSNPQSASSAPRKSGLLYATFGVVGGTLLVTLISILMHDWSYFTKWIGGVVAIAFVSAYLIARRKVAKGFASLTREDEEDPSRPEESPPPPTDSPFRKY